MRTISGERIESISCDEVNMNVVYTNWDGNLKLTYPGAHEQRDSVLGAPEDCPLLVNPKARHISNYLICQQCPYGSIESSEPEM